MTAVTRLVLRSLLIQALWNPRDLQGAGLAWALEREDDPLPAPYNGHPYLSGVALGALTHLDALEPPVERQLRDRFESALRAPLGALGDGLVWGGWVPFLSVVAVLLWGLGLGVGWILGLLLLIHALLQLSLRFWGVRLGLEYGLRVGSALGSSFLPRVAPVAKGGAFLLAGVLAGALASSAPALISPEGDGWSDRLPLLLALALVAVGGVGHGRLRLSAPLWILLALTCGAWLYGLFASTSIA